MHPPPGGTTPGPAAGYLVKDTRKHFLYKTPTMEKRQNTRWGRSKTPGSRSETGPHRRFLYVGAPEQGMVRAVVEKVANGPWSNVLICTPFLCQKQWKDLKDISLSFITDIHEAKAVILDLRPDLVIVADINLSTVSCDLAMHWILNIGSQYLDLDVALLYYNARPDIPMCPFTHLSVFPVGLDWPPTCETLGIPLEPRPTDSNPIELQLAPRVREGRHIAQMYT